MLYRNYRYDMFANVFISLLLVKVRKTRKSDLKYFRSLRERKQSVVSSQMAFLRITSREGPECGVESKLQK